MASQGSRDLDDEDVEDLGADEEGEEPGDTPGKPEADVHPSSLSDDNTPDEMDLSGSNNLNLNCNTSPRR